MGNEMVWTVVAIVVMGWIFRASRQRLKEPIAQEIAEERIGVLSALSFEKLVAMVGQGYTKEKILRQGGAYYLGYIIMRPGMLPQRHRENDPALVAAVCAGEMIDAVDVIGYVDYIDLFPVGYYKSGLSFGIRIKRDGSCVPLLSDA